MKNVLESMHIIVLRVFAICYVITFSMVIIVRCIELLVTWELDV